MKRHILRLAQRELAKELTELVFKKEGLESAVRISETFFSGKLETLKASEIKQALRGVPSISLQEDGLLVDILVDNGLIKSKREARTLITQGSISVNGFKVEDTDFVIKKDDAIENEVSIIKKGKKTYYVIYH